MLNLRRRLLNSKPKKTDTSLMAQFFYADVDLCSVAAELDSFDGRKNPARCAALVARLRQYQDRVLKLMQSMMDEVIEDQRAPRDFRVKYPEDLIQDGLAGQLWFGAECLSAGSSILNREVESESMRPIARSLTKQLDMLRQLLRDQSGRDPLHYTDKIKTSFIKFDQIFAEFELSYVSAMVPVKTMKEYDMSQEVTVLFSETVHRALAQGLITRNMLEYYDPELMFTIPRLAIITGLVIYPEGPLNPSKKVGDMSEMFRPFQSLLQRIRELLWTLCQEDLRHLERFLCNLEDSNEKKQSPQPTNPELSVEPHGIEDKSSHSMHLHTDMTNSTSRTTSLFNDISNLNDFSQASGSGSATNDRAGNSFETTLLDVLTGTQTTHSGGSGFSDSGNNNISGGNTAFPQSDASEVPVSDPLGVHEPLLNTEHIASSSSSTIIINDLESGVARLIIGNSGSVAYTEVEPALPGTEPTEPAIAAESNVIDNESSIRPTSLEYSVQSMHSEFAFNLPDTSPTSMSSSEHSFTASTCDEGCSSTEVQHNEEDVHRSVVPAPARVTIHRALSNEHPATAELPPRNVDNRHDSDSSTDSSSIASPGYLSDMDSSSSSDESISDGRPGGHRRQAFRALINSKSENLKKPYKNTEELIQKLFICVSGVADQLQSNFACDLRNILKCVFELHTADLDPEPDCDKKKPPTIATIAQTPPTWIPDSEMDKCCSCKLPFTVIRRRHHCRNCGLIFCGRCSANSAPLPNIGYNHAVRICNKCYVYRINPFFMDTGDEPFNSTTSRPRS